MSKQIIVYLIYYEIKKGRKKKLSISSYDYEVHNQTLKEKYNISTRANLFWGSFVLDMLELLAKLNLKNTEYRTLLYLCSLSNQDDNIAYIKQVSISEDLDINKSNLSRAIKDLREKQLIAKVDNGYMINPNLFYKGSARNNKVQKLHSIFKNKIENEKSKGNIDFSNQIQFDYFKYFDN